MGTFRIEVGHAHGVKPGNIVGAIANEAGLDAKHMGRIEIFDDYSIVDLPVPVGFWRSVGHSHQAFFKESFVDEAAAAAGQDPVAFRAALLGKHPTYPPADWRAVGDPDAMALTVQYTVAWMEAAVVYKQPVSELPLIPTNEHGDPAAGSRSVFDACLEGFRGGMSPSEIKSAWDAALREVTTATIGVPGWKKPTNARR